MAELSETDYTVNLHFPDGVHEFRFIGGPIDDPIACRPALTALGHAAAAWGRLEKHIDAVLIQVNKAQHSAKPLNLYDPKHPRPFTDKMRLLKTYFSKHPALKDHTASIRELAARLAELAKYRNSYLHGILEAYDDVGGTITINTIDSMATPGDFVVRKSVIPLNAVLEFVRLTQ